MKYIIRYSGSSHIGKHRNMNQDNFICDGKYMDNRGEPLKFPLSGTFSCDTPVMMGVFDGMGGEECGEVASYIAAKCALETPIGKRPLDDLLEYCRTANEKICDHAAHNGISEMGTTAAILVFSRSEISLCNIGDSKIFRFDDGKLEQISTDHHSAAPCGQKPPLSQNLGIPTSEMIIEPYVAKGLYNIGDVYLICSDGLTDMVNRDEMIQILEETQFEECVNRLQEKALDNGGRDNITIILCRVEQKRNSFFQKEISLTHKRMRIFETGGEK